jgi:Protein of unknown function (DUF1674)
LVKVVLRCRRYYASWALKTMSDTSSQSDRTSSSVPTVPAGESVAVPVVPAGGKQQVERPPLDPTRYGDWEKNGRCIDF